MATASSLRPETSRQRAVDQIEGAFALMARKSGLPRIHERMAAAARTSLDPSSFKLLRHLGEAGPIRASDLAASACLDLSTVSRQVAGLESLGLVERRRDPLDGRASLLLLSARGRAASSRLSEARRAMFGEMVTDWPEEDVERFAELLTRFARAMADLTTAASHESPTKETE
jgi:DNA-binding MarR family transcriptional regulator